MKFLLALSVLATTSVFAHGFDEHKIKCWDSAQENGNRRPSYIFEEEGHNGPGSLSKGINLVYPNWIQLEERHGCLKSRHNGPPSGATNPSKDFEACLGEGQEIGRLVPVEIADEEEDYEGTVYCEKAILDYLGDDEGDDDDDDNM